DEGLSGKFVSTEGVVTSARVSNSSTLYMTLGGGGGKEIQVVFFSAGERLFETGEKVSVSGEVSVYNGQLEILAKEIQRN
ncbi:MAG: OB-fold nucleic acid binding domain-containing protein, partial [Candidatus Aenigmatarchaeota archaeon]